MLVVTFLETFTISPVSFVKMDTFPFSAPLRSANFSVIELLATIAATLVSISLISVEAGALAQKAHQKLAVNFTVYTRYSY